MPLFSNRKRPYALGPYPAERLPRAAAGTVPLPEPAPNGGDPDGVRKVSGSLAASIVPYLGYFEPLRDGESAPQRAELDFDPARVADNLKSSCYFLDAAMAGICAMPTESWTAAAAQVPGLAAHTHALVIVVEHRTAPVSGGPGDDWLRGAQRARGVLHGGEIACCLAGYIRRLGFPARAHYGNHSEVRTGPLLVAAGLGQYEAGRQAVVNPFLGTAYEAAVVTTTLQAAPDRPLAQTRNGRAMRVRHAGHWLGYWGGRPGWKRLRGDHRPAHLGRYPMEKIKRVDKPTTYISGDVPRVPIRGSFFNRAVHGDLGEKARVERGRFALKHPYVAAMSPVFGAMVPHQDGEVAPTPAPGSHDPAANALAVKAACHFLGADLVGICETPGYAWYSHDREGNPVDADHKYAIAILIDQGYETMEGASGDDWISGAQSMRAYMRGADICGVLAHHIRSLGWSARSHTNVKSDVLHIPVILNAGLGEMSRIGELVKNPFLGPRSKSAIITTDMPLATDKPIDFGLQDFCEKCLKCARECPCAAIPLGAKVMFNGYEIWKPDAEKCARYRLTNMKGSACGRCMKMCPYNTEGLLAHRAWLWVAMHLPFTRRWLARLDDWLGHGKRNPVKRWWFDLEVVDGRVVRPRGAHERDLRSDLPIAPDRQKIAHYPADMNPPPGDLGAVPPDRAEALRRGAAAEAPPRP